MTDKTIVICTLLTALAVTAIVFVRRAMRYRKALGAVVPENEVIPEAETPPEVQPEPDPEFEAVPEEPSAANVYVSRFIFGERYTSKGDKTVSISAENHARIKWIMDEANWYGMSFSRYINGVLKEHFKDKLEVIERLFGEMPDELKNGIR